MRERPRTPDDGVHRVIGIRGEGHGEALVRDEGHRVRRHQLGVDGDHGDVALVGRVQLAEIGQLVDARRAMGRPQVDEHDLPPGVRQVEFGAVVARQREVRKLLTDLMADGRVAVVADRGGGLRFNRRFCLYRRFRGGGSIRFHRFCGYFCRRLLLLDFLPDGGIEEIEPHQGEAQHRQRRAPKDSAQPATLGRRVGGIFRAAHFRSLEGNSTRLDGDRSLFANLHALAAVNALMVAHMAHVHAAVPHAGATVVAAIHVHLHADDVESVEQTVDRPQRADEATEAAVAEHAHQADHQHDDELAGKQYAQHAVIRSVRRIGQMAHRAFEGACGTDILAEARQWDLVAQAIPQGDGDHKHRQYYIFQPGQRPGDAALFQLRRGDLMEKLLDQAQRAQPAADRPPQDHAEEHDDAQHIPARPMPGGGQRVLYGAQRAGTHRAGAGIAVEAGNAGVLRVAGVDSSINEALDIGVVQQGRIQLDEPPGRRPVCLPPAGFHIIQGQHTPYIS